MLFKKNKSSLTRLLVLRLSAMGDVAMTVPVIGAVATQNRDLRVTVVTRNRFVKMFEWMPANVQVMGLDLNEYEGLTGLARLYKELSRADYDAVADLHDVLRTKYVRTCFRMGGTRVAVIDKGRKDKHALVGHGQDAEPLRHGMERYADVFRQLGIEVDMSLCQPFSTKGEDFLAVNAFAGRKEEGERWVGIAPFAAHEQKVYPLDRMNMVAQMLLERGCKVFLFGAGPKESEELKGWECAGMRSTCGQLNGLHDEMLLMSKLDLMISMDSANMHIASLFGVPVLSIWGATHPKAGFTGWRQSPDSIVQADLPCRPCSIYGNKPCQYGDMRCMKAITPEMVVEKAMRMLVSL